MSTLIVEIVEIEKIVEHENAHSLEIVEIKESMPCRP